MLHTTLRHYEIFLAVAEAGTVTAAAARLGLTQSAASQAIAGLERQLGTQLFDRVGKRLSLSEDGRALMAPAHDLLDRAREIEERMSGAPTAAGGTVGGVGRFSLRLGASSTIGNYLLPALIGRFMRAHPGSELALQVGNSASVMAGVKSFDLDMGFIEGPCHDAELAVTPWRRDELAIYAAPSDPMARGTPTLAALRAAPWILREAGSGTREVAERLLDAQLGGLRVAMELGGTEAIKRAVEAGLGISLLPVVAAETERLTGRLIRLAAPGLAFERQLNIILHREKYRGRGLQALMTLCLAPPGPEDDTTSHNPWPQI